jgi:hypothetical protein
MVLWGVRKRVGHLQPMHAERMGLCCCQARGQPWWREERWPGSEWRLKEGNSRVPPIRERVFCFHRASIERCKLVRLLLLPSPRDIRAYNIIAEDTSYPLASQPSTYFSTPHSHILRVIKYAHSRHNHFSQQSIPLQIVPIRVGNKHIRLSPSFTSIPPPFQTNTVKRQISHYIHVRNSIIHSILRFLFASSHALFRVSHPVDLLDDVVSGPYWVDSGMTSRATATSVLQRALPR